jgi:phage shock protein PspC (stress-responsive transcriptional regulator)
MDISTDTKPRLVRRSDHRFVAGVAGGLADYTGTNAIWWRIGFAVFTPAAGVAVAVYLLAWFLIPRADLPRSAAQHLGDQFPDAPSWLGIGLLLLGAVLLAGQLGIWRPAVGWGVLLIGLGFVLFRRDAERREAAPPAPPAPPAVPTTPVTEVIDERSPWASTAPQGLAPPARPIPRAPRDHSVLGWISLGLALSLGGLLWMLRSSGSAAPSNAQILAAPLLVLAAGLLVGAFIGHAKWTVLFALPIVPLVMLTNVITVPLNGSWNRHTVAPVRAGDLASTYQQSGGDLIFDLRQLKDGQLPASTSADLGIGEIQVVVPQCMPVAISAKVGVGSVQLFDTTREGAGPTASVANSAPAVRMQLHVGAGTIDVYREFTNKGGC